MSTAPPPINPETTLRDHFADPAEAAEALRVTRNTVYRLLDSGTLVGIRRGHRRLISRTSLAALVAARSEVAS